MFVCAPIPNRPPKPNTKPSFGLANSLSVPQSQSQSQSQFQPTSFTPIADWTQPQSRSRARSQSQSQSQSQSHVHLPSPSLSLSHHLQLKFLPHHTPRSLIPYASRHDHVHACQANFHSHLLARSHSHSHSAFHRIQSRLSLPVTNTTTISCNNVHARNAHVHSHSHVQQHPLSTTYTPASGRRDIPALELVNWDSDSDWDWKPKPPRHPILSLNLKSYCSDQELESSRCNTPISPFGLHPSSSTSTSPVSHSGSNITTTSVDTDCFTPNEIFTSTSPLHFLSAFKQKSSSGSPTETVVKSSASLSSPSLAMILSMQRALASHLAYLHCQQQFQPKQHHQQQQQQQKQKQLRENPNDVEDDIEQDSPSTATSTPTPTSTFSFTPDQKTIRKRVTPSSSKEDHAHYADVYAATTTTIPTLTVSRFPNSTNMSATHTQAAPRSSTTTTCSSTSISPLTIRNISAGTNVSTSLNFQLPSNFVLPERASWFLLNTIHPCENQAMQWIKGKEQVYLYIRDWILFTYRRSPFQYLAFTTCCTFLALDVTQILSVHRFLNELQLINAHTQPTTTSHYLPLLEHAPIILVEAAEWPKAAANIAQKQRQKQRRTW